MIVVDTNVIGYLYLTSARTAQAEAAYTKNPSWAAPLPWRSELRNVLAGYLRKNLLSVSDAGQIMDSAIGLLAGREYLSSSKPCWD
jgi:hypothetical protein